MSTIIINNPKITEKTSKEAQKNVYTFDVSTHANKHQIKTELEKMYKVTVKSVRVVTKKGKLRRVGKKMSNKVLSDRKIAYITVSEGTIDLFPKS